MRWEEREKERKRINNESLLFRTFRTRAKKFLRFRETKGTSRCTMLIGFPIKTSVN